MSNNTIGAGTTFGFGYFFSGTGLTLANYGVIAGQGVHPAAGKSMDWVVNAGTITGTNYGVVLYDGAVTNLSTGTIATGNRSGVYINGTSWAVVNAGIITASQYGVVLGVHGGTIGSGSVTNLSGGLITGFNGGVLFHGASNTLVNAGSIGGFTAVEMHSGAVTNLSGGVITGDVGGTDVNVTNYGVIVGNVSTGGTLINGIYGTISGGGANYLINAGIIKSVINAFGGGSITNQSSGTIVGVSGAFSLVTVQNSGSVSGGLNLPSGLVTNEAGGRITGLVGISITGTVTNYGTVAGGTSSSSGYGIKVEINDVVTNGSPGLITGYDGIFGAFVSYEAGANLTVVNAGTIQGVKDAILFGSAYSNRLIIDPGAVFVGTVDGGNTIGGPKTSYLELASAATAGTIAGLGTQFIDFAQVALGAGATWDVQGAVVAGETIGFLSDASLQLSNPGGVAGRVVNFAPGETIDLVGVDPTSVGFASGTLSFSGGAIPLSFTGGVIHAAASSDGAAVTVTCFRAGTRIMTMHGDVAVEHLSIGDQVRLARGSLADIVWLAHRRIDCTRHPAPHTIWPVRIIAGAFGNGRPKRDLWLSPDHAVFVDGVLIPVKYLVNGLTVTQVPVADVTYFHVELADHDVLLAEGLPVESYLGTGGRANFDHGGTSLMLHPDFATRTWEAHSCAPLVITGPALEAVRATLNQIPLGGRLANSQTARHLRGSVRACSACGSLPEQRSGRRRA